MIYIISPAKKLDFSNGRYTEQFSQPTFQHDTQQLVGALAKKSPKKLKELMDISDNLAQLNYERYQSFSFPFSPENAKQALLSFKGDVYQQIDVENFSEEEFSFAQKHLRILSGLYGLLKPLDLIQPYRLEMGTKFKSRRGKNLYEFWGDRITKALNESFEESGSNVLINVASNEYFKSVNKKKLAGRVINFSFKDERNGSFKTIFLFAKQARGALCDYGIKNHIDEPEALKGFDRMGYMFNPSLSTEDDWVFTR